MSVQGCGSRTTMGHGDVAVCGQLYWHEIFVCDKCKIAGLSKRIAELEALTQGQGSVPSPQGSGKTVADAVTPDQRERLIDLARLLRTKAAPVGPMHGAWNTIFDIEALLQGKPTMLTMSIDEWIAFAERQL